MTQGNSEDTRCLLSRCGREASSRDRGLGPRWRLPVACPRWNRLSCCERGLKELRSHMENNNQSFHFGAEITPDPSLSLRENMNTMSLF